jgi:hypothetical protein
MIYDECCANGCGLLVDDSEWEKALSVLVMDPQRRFEQVQIAQHNLNMNYSVERLREQVLEILALASELVS